MKRPDLFDVLQVVRRSPGAQSYVYRNMLHSEGHRDFTTALVLARLRKLEALGKVRRTSPSRFAPFCWTPVDPWLAPTPDRKDLSGQSVSLSPSQGQSANGGATKREPAPAPAPARSENPNPHEEA